MSIIERPVGSQTKWADFALLPSIGFAFSHCRLLLLALLVSQLNASRSVGRIPSPVFFSLSFSLNAKELVFLTAISNSQRLIYPPHRKEVTPIIAPYTQVSLISSYAFQCKATARNERPVPQTTGTKNVNFQCKATARNERQLPNNENKKALNSCTMKCLDCEILLLSDSTYRERMINIGPFTKT